VAYETPRTNAELDIKQTPVSSLVALHTAVVNELMARHLGHNRTSPVADLPDQLVAAAYDGEPVRGHQAWSVDAGGRRLLVRSRLRLPTDKPSTAYAPITDWNFDAAVFLVLDALTCQVIKAVEVPADPLKKLAVPGSSKISARIRVDQDLMTLEDARDVTSELEKALEVIDAERFARRISDDATAGGADERPTGQCMCGCGQPTDPGARFLVMHDRRADSPVLRERYGQVKGLVVT